MKVVVFGSERRVGAIVGDRVIDLNRADPELPSDLADFVALGRAAVERTDRALRRIDGASEPSDLIRPLADVKLHPPVVPNARIACAGGNYALHIAGARAARGEPITPDEAYREFRAGGPWGFWKITGEILGPDDDIPYPTRADLLDYEGELAVVIGARASDVSVDGAVECFLGVTLLNDWSIRGRDTPRNLSFNLSKNFDGSTTIGPCMVIGEVDPQDVEVQTLVNGAVRQRYRTSEMIFSFAEYLAFLSRDLTFRPGDVISGGSGAGTAMDSSRPRTDGSRPTDLYLRPGDVVEVRSPTVGVLRNRVVAKSARSSVGSR